MSLDNLKDELEELKELRLRLGRDAQRLSAERHITEERINTINKELGTLDFELEITDHAIVRYLKRIENLDIEKIKRQIIPDKFIKQYKKELKIGWLDGEYPVNDFYILKIINNKIITVIEQRSPILEQPIIFPNKRNKRISKEQEL